MEKTKTQNKKKQKKEEDVFVIIFNSTVKAVVCGLMVKANGLMNRSLKKPLWPK